VFLAFLASLKQEMRQSSSSKYGTLCLDQLYLMVVFEGFIQWKWEYDLRKNILKQYGC